MASSRTEVLLHWLCLLNVATVLSMIMLAGSAHAADTANVSCIDCNTTNPSLPCSGDSSTQYRTLTCSSDTPVCAVRQMHDSSCSRFWSGCVATWGSSINCTYNSQPCTWHALNLTLHSAPLLATDGKGERLEKYLCPGASTAAPVNSVPTAPQAQSDLDTAVVVLSALCGISIAIMVIITTMYICCGVRLGSTERMGRRLPTLQIRKQLRLQLPCCCGNGDTSDDAGLNMDERKIASEIQLLEELESGEFATIHRADWHGQIVTVKAYQLHAEGKFRRELEMFSTYMMSHTALQAWYAADVCENTADNNSPELWLVFERHPNGCLRDYLHSRCMTDNPEYKLGFHDLKHMMSSLFAGLMHLHSHHKGQGYSSKPSIVHRALSSQTVLVKDDGTCCLSDLSCAVKQRASGPFRRYIDASNLQVGYPRYMPPEVLTNSVDTGSFEELRKVDIYAAALVSWEIANVCVPTKSNERPAFERAYEHVVPSNPCVEDMVAAVCKDNVRPYLPEWWKSDESMRTVHRVLHNSWKVDIYARFAANRVWRNIHDIQTFQEI